MAERVTAEELAAVRRAAEDGARHNMTPPVTPHLILRLLDEIEQLRADLKREHGGRAGDCRILGERVNTLTAELDTAVVREVTLRKELGRANNILADIWGHGSLDIEDALAADPSPGAKRHMERVAALERFAATYRRQAELAGAAIDLRSRRVWSTAWHEFCEAEDALRALDEAPR